MPVLAIAGRAGSSGKTTLAVNAAALLARFGDRAVRVVDLDAQANASHWLGQHEPDQRPTVSDVLLRGAKLIDAARDVPDIPGLSIVPARRAEMEGTEVELARKIGGGATILRMLLQADPAPPETVTFLDCPGALGALTVAALVAADAVVTVFAPMEKEAAGIAAIEDTVEQVAAGYNPALRLAAVVPSIVPANAGHYYRDVLRQVATGWGDRVTPPVRRSVRVPESYTAQQPLVVYAPEESVTDDLADVVDHLLETGVIPRT